MRIVTLAHVAHVVKIQITVAYMVKVADPAGATFVGIVRRTFVDIVRLALMVTAMMMVRLPHTVTLPFQPRFRYAWHICADHYAYSWNLNSLTLAVRLSHMGAHTVTPTGVL